MTVTAEAPSTRSARSRKVPARSSDWAARGLCVRSDPDALFVRGAAQQTAKLVCQKCPVIAQCLADALDNRTEFGVWGGMTERERRALLRRRPNVSSWWDLFVTARPAPVQASAAS